VAGNRIAADAVNRHPDRFAAYCAVSPNYPEDEMLGQLEACVSRGACCAIKIHPATHDYAANGPAYAPMWAFAHENRLPVLVHTWGGDPLCGPLLFDDIGRDYPEARIILGHSGASVMGIRESVEAARSRPNLYLDLTKSFMHQGLLEEMVAAVGAERVLFGTDVPFIDCRSQIGYVASARIPDSQKRLIFGHNAVALFGLERLALSPARPAAT
jgi:predicted TIM-barrel fold metal-dependent hydrolase